MAFRADIRIDWTTSPRIITVAAPSTSLLIQDLVDTLRTLEAYFDNLDNTHILDAAGKQPLGTLLNPITVKLRDALLSFEARLGPAWVNCVVTSGNLVAVNALGVYYASPIYNTAFVNVNTQQSLGGGLVNEAAMEADLTTIKKRTALIPALV